MTQAEIRPDFQKDRGETIAFWAFMFLIALVFVAGVLLLVKVKHDELRAPATADERAHYAERAVCTSKSEFCRVQQEIYRELIQPVSEREALSVNQLRFEAAQIRSRSLELAAQEIARRDAR